MNNCICLDSSVLVKVLVPEEDSDRATALLQKIIESRQIIVLPAFAWAEIGTVLRKKRRKGELTTTEADELWQEFRQFPGIEYLTDDSVIMDHTWKISRYFDFPTLYDAAFLAVAEIIAERTGETCEYWTADEKLVNQLNGRREYVRSIKQK
jgi:predicted nucleic acid-binding protein